MRTVWIIARREFRRYFTSPVGYLVLFLYLFILGLIVNNSLQQAYAFSVFQGAPPPGADIVIGPMLTLLVFSIPALTMRLLAEEQASGTLELLLTAPVRDWELVVGKWLGAFLFVVVLLALTLIYPLALHLLTEPGLDWGPVISGYLGLLLVSAALLALGVAVSALFRSQVAAFVVTLALFLFLWMISSLASAGSPSEGVLRYLDFGHHFYTSFFRGVIDLQGVVYYLSVTAFGLFVGTVIIESRRWRG
ncbi:MAG: ABC transporter permease subunit [Chloroflexi bacterium]|nr:ABC transporter permease subunit [Chloroflexota bacterium]